jgi:hypothetical protein
VRDAAVSITGVGITNFVVALTGLVTALGTLIGLVMHTSRHGPQETTITHVTAPAPEPSKEP